MAEIKPEVQTFAKIKVIGVGGGGGAAINRMIKSGIQGVEFYALNSDVQDLHNNLAPNKIHIGKTVTKGLGCGMDPEMGRLSAEENQNEIRDAIKGADMVFITCGLGGGTGTGAAPVVADLARDVGALTVAVVTKPFAFEGAQRRNIGEKGHAELKGKVDTIITIPNDRLLQIIDKKTLLLDAFAVADEVLRQGVQGISDIITIPGLINVDFADVKAIIKNAGSALMGIGIASGENRAVDAAKKAIASPLLDISIEGAKGVLLTITGSSSLSMYEVNEAAKIVTNLIDQEAKVIFGAVIDEDMQDDLKITVMATGFSKEHKKVGEPVISSVFPNNRSNNTFKSEIKENRSNLEIRKKPVFEDVLKKEEFIPNNNSNGNLNKISKESIVEDDLEIPAFIRKKMM